MPPRRAGGVISRSCEVVYNVCGCNSSCSPRLLLVDHFFSFSSSSFGQRFSASAANSLFGVSFLFSPLRYKKLTERDYV